MGGGRGGRDRGPGSAGPGLTWRPCPQPSPLSRAALLHSKWTTLDQTRNQHLLPPLLPPVESGADSMPALSTVTSHKPRDITRGAGRRRQQLEHGRDAHRAEGEWKGGREPPAQDPFRQDVQAWLRVRPSLLGRPSWGVHVCWDATVSKTDKPPTLRDV